VRVNHAKECTMKRLAVSPAFVALALLCGPQVTLGQEDEDGGGLGGFLDWIHKLSGPSMLGPAGSWYWEGETVRFRIAGAYLVPVASDDKIDDGHTLNMLSLRPLLEVPVWGPLEVGAGLDVHRFGGKGHSPVVGLSIPLYGQLRFAVGSREKWYPRIGLGARYFPSFEAGDFNQGVHVKTDGGEVTFAVMLGLDYVLRDRAGPSR
jgi:hypothetical protein